VTEQAVMSAECSDRIEFRFTAGSPNKGLNESSRASLSGQHCAKLGSSAQLHSNCAAVGPAQHR
jgi:hypothetical protein